MKTNFINLTGKICIIMSLCATTMAAFAQPAKKPTLMVLPSDVWCNLHGYMKTYDDQGSKISRPDYKRAVQENPDLLAVTSAINGIMADNGFELKNLESCLKTLESESAEDATLQSKTGSSISESPIDKLKKTAKADIIIQVTWDITTTGPKKTLRFNLQGLDAYTDKQVATAEGTGKPSFTAEVPKLIEEAVTDKMPLFIASLKAHFDDMFKNGREIIVRVKKFDSWNGDLEKEYGGKELGSIIEDWMKAHTVNGRFSTSESTGNIMLFEQVRIPLFDPSGNATDARGFVKGLQKFLTAQPYGITNKLMMKGLGQAVVVLGEK